MLGIVAEKVEEQTELRIKVPVSYGVSLLVSIGTGPRPFRF